MWTSYWWMYIINVSKRFVYIWVLAVSCSFWSATPATLRSCSIYHCTKRVCVAKREGKLTMFLGSTVYPAREHWIFRQIQCQILPARWDTFTEVLFKVHGKDLFAKRQYITHRSWLCWILRSCHDLRTGTLFETHWCSVLVVTTSCPSGRVPLLQIQFDAANAENFTAETTESRVKKESRNGKTSRFRDSSTHSLRFAIHDWEPMHCSSLQQFSWLHCWSAQMARVLGRGVEWKVTGYCIRG